MSVDIKRLTAHLSPQQQAAVRKIYRERAESSTAAFISCFFLGVFGAHRFYLKQWRQGFLHLLLAAVIALVVVGGLLLNLPIVTVVIIAGILLLLALFWVIVDLVRIDDEVASHNIKLAEMLIAQTLLSDRTVEQQADAKLESLLRETAAQADAAANYGRMQMDDHTGALTGTLSPNDTAAAAPVAAVGAVTAQYVATTVTQVSDDPNATQHGSQKAPETEQKQAAPHTESSVESDTVSDVPAEAALAGAAFVPLVSEVVTHTHEVSGYSVTDGVETMSTASIPEPPQPESAAFEAIAPELLPTSEEANAATWPSHPSVQFDEPVARARWVAPDVTDRGDIAGDVKPVADIDPAGVLPLHVALDDMAGATNESDAAVGAGLGAAAFGAAAPLVAESAAYTANAAESPVMAVEPASAEPAPADEGLLFLVPEDAPAASPSFETPAEAYIPPVVPVVTTPEAATAPAEFAAEPEPVTLAEPVMADTAEAAAFETVPEAAPAAYDAPAAHEPEPVQHTHSGGETLAELGAFAGLAGLAGLATSAADEAVSLARAHRQSLAAAETEAETPAAETLAEPVSDAAGEQVAPAQPETLAEFAASPAPVEGATPAPAPSEAEVAEPVAAAEPEREAVPVVATAAGLAAATDAELLAQHKLKRIRVVRQLKVDGKVVEETAAEEYVDPDVDPEPVKARLREQLRQQAQERATAQGETNG